MTGTPGTQAWIGSVLAAHNQVRACASPTPSPALPALTWSASVAAVAQAWANQCTFTNNPGLGFLGENLYATSAQTGAGDFVTAWAAERVDFDYAANSCSSSTCLHYTQLVWRTTTEVGCAQAMCMTGGPFGGPWVLTVCDYSPPGNFLGQRPY